jgi:DNA-binding response OmpR family regulator
MPGKILLADDDKNILELYTRIFREKDYSLTKALSFAEASGLIEANHYDLLVTDLMFPDGLGTELITLFEEKRAGAKSLLVTGEPDVQEKLKLAGITGYFPKPFNLQHFTAAVEKALGE